MSNVITNPIEQTKKFDELKETYGFVRTDDMLQAFYDKGWKQVQTDIVGVRDDKRQGYQKHLIKMEHPDFPEIPDLEQRNKSIPQLCLLNSHDGTSSLRMFIGVLRLVCLNGLIAGVAVKDMRLVHSKHIMKRVPDAIDFMANAIPQMIEQVQLLQGKTFSEAALQEFVRTCVNARLQNVKKIVTVDYESANKIIRPEDSHNDAYTVLNRIQESIIRGGINYSYERNVKNDVGEIIGTRLTHTRTRGLKSVSGQVRLNRLVYDKALEIAG